MFNYYVSFLVPRPLNLKGIPDYKMIEVSVDKKGDFRTIRKKVAESINEEVDMVIFIGEPILLND